MVTPLPPQQIRQALSSGSQEELDEFQRLVEKNHLAALSPQIMHIGDKARLQALRNKLFPPAPATVPSERSHRP